MFFTDKEKSIYTPSGSDISYDPLRLNHLLTIESGNRLNELIALRNAQQDNLGDVSKEGKNRAAVEAAKAELELVEIARKAFYLTDVKKWNDASVLEVLYEFLGWLEGKDETAGKPLLSELSHEPTRSLSGSSST